MLITLTLCKEYLLCLFVVLYQCGNARHVLKITQGTSNKHLCTVSIMFQALNQLLEFQKKTKPLLLEEYPLYWSKQTNWLFYHSLLSVKIQSIQVQHGIAKYPDDLPTNPPDLHQDSCPLNGHSSSVSFFGSSLFPGCQSLVFFFPPYKISFLESRE